MEREKQLVLLARLKQSQALGRFFASQRQGKTEVTEEVEKLQLEWLLARYICRSQKNFLRADAYRLMLHRLGVPVDEIDLELHPSRTTPEWWLKTKGGQTC